MYKGFVYFDRDGNQYSNVYWRYEHHVTDEELAKRGLTRRDNFIFKDKLQVVDVWHGMRLKSVHNSRIYYAFRSDVIKFIPQLVNGYIEGFFTFRKNGRRIGLIPVVFDFEDYTPKEMSVFQLRGPFTSQFVGS